MYKSAIVHYKNKYPKCKIIADDERLDVYDKDGEYVVALRNIHGQWRCVSKENGCKDQHDLAPIPKNTRVWKLYEDGSIKLSEEASARKKVSLLVAIDGKVPAISEIVPAGLTFDHNWSFPENSEQDNEKSTA